MSSKTLTTYQICYVLTSSSDDCYAEMCHISASLARAVEPKARIIVLVDEYTHRSLLQRSAAILSTAHQVIAVETNESNATVRSRFVKTSMRQHLNGDFLFLDADTLPIKRFNEIWKTSAAVAASLNRDQSCSKPYFPQSADDLYHRLGWHTPLPLYFNSGVMFFSDTPQSRALGEEWHNRWKFIHKKTGVCTDQYALNSSIYYLDVKVEELPVPYNAVIEASPWFSRQAKILHFYTTGGRPKPDTLLGHLVDTYMTSGIIDWKAVKRTQRRGDPWIKLNRDVQRLVATRHYFRAFCVAYDIDLWARRFLLRLPVFWRLLR